jgi:hypothetical protein
MRVLWWYQRPESLMSGGMDCGFVIDDESGGSDGSEDEDNSIDNSNHEVELPLRSHFACPDHCCGEEVNPTKTMRTAAYPNVDEKI